MSAGPVARVVAETASGVGVLRSTFVKVDVAGLQIADIAVGRERGEHGAWTIVGEATGPSKLAGARIGADPIDAQHIGIG